MYVAGFGEGFKVHDGGGAVRAAWDHGREISLVRRMLARQATFHQLKVIEDTLVSEVPSEEWLVSAVLAVANASAAAAFSVVERSATASDDGLRERIYKILSDVIPQRRLARDYEITGKSGKKYAFNFALRRTDDDWILIDAVSPHHVSIAAKYVAFADTKDQSDMVASRFAVYERTLEPDDAALISQVADLAPFAGLDGGIRRELNR